MMSSTEDGKLDKMIIDYWYPVRVGVEVMREKKKKKFREKKPPGSWSSENEK